MQNPRRAGCAETRSFGPVTGPARCHEANSPTLSCGNPSLPEGGQRATLAHRQWPFAEPLAGPLLGDWCPFVGIPPSLLGSRQQVTGSNLDSNHHCAVTVIVISGTLAQRVLFGALPRDLECPPSPSRRRCCTVCAKSPHSESKNSFYWLLDRG